jgi:hypothetical protein
VIVFEKQPRWAPEFQRQFQSDDVRVIACRSVKDVEKRSAGVASGVVLLDASVATSECFQFLRNNLSDPRALPTVIIASKQISQLEWAFREVGTAAFFVNRIPGHEMAALCRKLWSRRNAGRSERSSSRLTQGSGHS